MSTNQYTKKVVCRSLLGNANTSKLAWPKRTAKQQHKDGLDGNSLRGVSVGLELSVGVGS